ncbi:MAG: hypothetical protein JXR54_09855 [Tannerellaceae bacterium]|nr:hypothetical protein [Tannerellaceae bacterium]
MEELVQFLWIYDSTAGPDVDVVYTTEGDNILEYLESLEFRVNMLEEINN